MTTIHSPSKTTLYGRCAAAADRGAWSVERDIGWAEIDRERAFARPDILASLRDAVLIESYHPLNLARLLRATLDDIDAGVVFSLELYEGFKHFHSLRRYLDTIAYEPAITDEELVTIRQAQTEIDLLPGELVPQLVEFMLSEHLATTSFADWANRLKIPCWRICCHASPRTKCATPRAHLTSSPSGLQPIRR